MIHFINIFKKNIYIYIKLLYFSEIAWHTRDKISCNYVPSTPIHCHGAVLSFLHTYLCILLLHFHLHNPVLQNPDYRHISCPRQPARHILQLCHSECHSRARAHPLWSRPRQVLFIIHLRHSSIIYIQQFVYRESSANISRYKLVYACAVIII